MSPRKPARALRAVVYVRLSVHRGVTDPTTSPARQREACEAYCLSQGWEVAEVVEDLDVSGSAKGLRLDRPGLRRVRAMLDEVDVVIFSKLDRLARNVGDFKTFAEEAADHDVALVSVVDKIDLTSASGRFFATILAAFAEMESDTIADRIRGGIAGSVAARRHRGGVAPFGYRSVPHSDGAGRALAIDPEEAAHVRAAADVVLDGGSAYAAMQLLRSRGSKPRRAKDWALSSVIAVLTGDSLLGRMRHLGALVREADGTIAQPWPALLTLDEAERLRALLAPTPAPQRRKRATRLASGLLHCQSCGSRLRVSSSSTGLRYACRGDVDGDGCTRPVSIVADALDAHLESEFLARYADQPEVIVETRVVDVAGLAEIEEAIGATASAMTAPGADIASLAATLAGLHARREALDEAKPETVAVETGRTMGQAWANGDTDHRRGLLKGALAMVVVAPGVRGRRGLDTSRLTLVDSPAFSLDAEPAATWRRGRVVVGASS